MFLRLWRGCIGATLFSFWAIFVESVKPCRTLRYDGEFGSVRSVIEERVTSANCEELRKAVGGGADGVSAQSRLN